jgi:hypothetical protein
MTRWKVSITNLIRPLILANIPPGHRNAIRLLAEQSDRERQRQELLAQRNALLQGKQVLHELQQKKYNNTTSSRVSSVDAVSSARHSPVGVETPTSEGMDEEM